MSEISDELVEWCNGVDVDGDACDTPRVIAERIDAEMVELPRDADGVPVHLNDTVYDSHGKEWHVNFMTLCCNGDATVRVGDGVCSTTMMTDVLTHKCPDSFERIADEIDEWLICASNSHNFCQITDDSENALRDISGRIRKLAKEQTNE